MSSKNTPHPNPLPQGERGKIQVRCRDLSFLGKDPMAIVMDALYLFVLLLLSPYLIYKACTTGKYRRGLCCKFTGYIHPCDRPLPAHADSTQPVAWFHGVSVGEVHMLGPIVQRFRERHPDWICAISTTTDTGYEEAKKR